MDDKKTLDELEQQVIDIGTSIGKMFKSPRTENSISLSTKLDVVLVQLESIRAQARILEDEAIG